jgi:hypothetical protein
MQPLTDTDVFPDAPTNLRRRRFSRALIQAGATGAITLGFLRDLANAQGKGSADDAVDCTTERVRRELVSQYAKLENANKHKDFEAMMTLSVNESYSAGNPDGSKSDYAQMRE